MVKKRRMPAHIVLPNGMWRFVKAGTKKVSSLRKPKRSKRTRRGLIMARRSRKSYSRKGSSMGGGKLMNGFFPMHGMLNKVLVGIAASEISEQVAPKVIPYQNLAVAGIVGGLPAVAGAFAFNMLQGKGATNATNTGITFY